jgi:tripartite-type tricarboxylate transporter receptor subunit TctC
MNTVFIPMLRGLLSALALACIGAHAQQAENYPNKPVRLIVSSIAGSANDVLVRLAAPKVADRLGQAMLVDNRGGANGIPALNATAQAAPDGYTIMSAGNLLVLNGVLKRVSFDIRKALDPVAQLSSQPYILLAHPSVPANTLKELIAHAKSKPNAVVYGSSGLGAVNHLGTALLANRAGVEMVHVPYKGNAQAITDLLSGRIHLLFASGVTATPHLKSAKLKAIVISGAKRSPAFPDIPTVAESGLPGYEVTNAYFMYVPAGTPAGISQLLNKEFTDAVNAPDVRAKLAPDGIDPGERQSLAALKDAYVREYATWENFLKTTGLQLGD